MRSSPLFHLTCRFWSTCIPDFSHPPFSTSCPFLTPQHILTCLCLNPRLRHERICKCGSQSRCCKPFRWQWYAQPSNHTFDQNMALAWTKAYQCICRSRNIKVSIASQLPPSQSQRPRHPATEFRRGAARPHSLSHHRHQPKQSPIWPAAWF